MTTCSACGKIDCAVDHFRTSNVVDSNGIPSILYPQTGTTTVSNGTYSWDLGPSSGIIDEAPIGNAESPVFYGKLEKAKLCVVYLSPADRDKLYRWMHDVLDCRVYK